MPDSNGGSSSGGGGGGNGSGNSTSPPAPPVPATIAGLSPTDLVQLVTSTMLALQANQPAGAAPPARTAQPPPAPVIPSQTIAPGTSGMSIPDQFPQVDESVLHEIAAHTFSPRDLWKLDERYAHAADKKRLFDLETGKFADSSAPKSFPSLPYLLVPLEAYFSVVTAYLAPNNSGAAVAYVQRCFQEFRVDLIRLSEDYAWPAVLNYFTAFFLQRRAEMRAGKYEGWSQIDTVLQNRHLVGHPRFHFPVSSATPAKAKAAPASADRSSEVCFAFNTDKSCSGGASKCRDGRFHGCRKCDEMGVRPPPQHSMRSSSCPYYGNPLAPAANAAR